MQAKSFFACIRFIQFPAYFQPKRTYCITVMKMSKKKKKPGHPGADPRLAAQVPTAVSPEFVPLTPETMNSFGTNDSADVYDFIPELKDEQRFQK